MITVRTDRFEDILSTLEQLDSWLRELGIQPKNDRIHQAIEIVRKAEEGLQKFRATKEPAKIGNIRDFYFGLVEAFEFYDIFRAFKDERPAALAPKLIRALSGPLRPAEETKRNADARNVMFELALAAHLRLHGGDVSIGEPDVTVHLNGAPFIVECKRPFREESIRSNVRAAAHQLKTKLDSSVWSNSMGLVAVSVGRILNPGTYLYKVPTVGAARVMAGALEHMMHENERHWAKLDLHPRLSAVLFHAITPAFVEDKDIVARMGAVTIMPAGKEGPAFDILQKELPPLFET